MSPKRPNPGQIIADLHLKLAQMELDRDLWRNQVVGIREQQREALRRAESVESELRGVTFRVDAACSGYEHLMDNDVPASDDPASYQNGAAEAAKNIRHALVGEPREMGETVRAGTGDALDVAAGRCCANCRIDLTEHNREVWNAGYSVGSRARS